MFRQNEGLRLGAVIAAWLICVASLGVHAGQRGGGPPPPPPPPPAGPPGVLASPQVTGSGLILGRVVESDGRTPVDGALVTLSGTVSLPPPSPLSSPSTGSSPSVGTLLPRRVLTDGQGRFTFRDLPKGSFRIGASAPTFGASSYGQKRANGISRDLALGAGERIGDVAILMWKLGSISGTVLDDGGEPAVGVQVALLMVNESSGRRQLQMTGATNTDDRGIYRFGNLSPGEFVVAVPSTVTTMPSSVMDDMAKAQSEIQFLESIGDPIVDNPVDRLMTAINSSGGPTPIGTGLKVSESFQLQLIPSAQRTTTGAVLTNTGRVMAYQTVFYPAAPISTQASVVKIGTGENRMNVDMPLRLVPALSVSGVLRGPAGPQPHFGLKLLPAGVDELSNEAGFESARTVTDANGAFTFLGVTPGAYTIKGLRVVQAPPITPITSVVRNADGTTRTTTSSAVSSLPSDPTLWSQLAVNVGDTDVVGLNMTLRSGVSISGRFEFDGTTQRPSADVMQRLRMAIISDDSRAIGANPQARVSANNTFTTQGIPPGTYSLQIGAVSGPEGAWSLKSIVAAGRNVTSGGLVLSENDVTGVIITLTDQSAGELSGIVRMPMAAATNKPADLNVMVTTFPVEWATANMSSRAIRSSTAGPDGAFRLSGLPAGEYFVVAIDADTTEPMSSSRLFESVSRIGTRVRIGESERKTVDLQLSVVR